MEKPKRYGKLRLAMIVLLCGVMAFSGYQLYRSLDGYRQADQLKKQLLPYRPDFEEQPAPEQNPTAPAVLHPEIAGLQEVNGDVLGWIRIPDTEVDYPIVQAADNQYYLRRDIYGEHASAGSIFMDNRCDRELGGFNTILYGHKMRNGSMFADISDFRKQSYFDAHPVGYLATAYHTYQIDFFAFLLIDSRADAYNVQFSSPEDIQTHLQYIRKNARVYREIGMPEDGQIITLSTCSYEFNTARSVLIGKMSCIQ